MPETQTPEPAVSLACGRDRIHLRVDDYANPEFWLQLELDSFGNVIRAEGRHLHPAPFDSQNIIGIASLTNQFRLQVRDSLNKNFALNLVLADDKAEIAHLFHPTFSVWTHYQEHNPDPRPYLNHLGERVSERMVLKSAAGFYVGRLSHHRAENDFPYLYSRESEEYFSTREKAQAALDERTFTFRISPIS